MRDFNQILQILSSEKEHFQSKYFIKYIGVFGSYSRKENTKNSDIDIIVDFVKPIGIEFIDLADEIEEILQIKVDLVSKNGIKPKYFDQIKNDIIYV